MKNLEFITIKMMIYIVNIEQYQPYFFCVEQLKF